MDRRNPQIHACPIDCQPVSVLIKTVQYKLRIFENGLQVAFPYEGVDNLDLQVRIKAKQAFRCQMGLGICPDQRKRRGSGG